MSGKGKETGAPALQGEALADAADAALAAHDLPAALWMFDRAEAEVKDPDRCAGGRWMAHMLGGNFEAAWREADAIRQRGAPDPHRFWNGEDLRGRRLMLRSLHGFGDAVQMFRFLPRLREIVSELIVEVPPRLVALAPSFVGMGQVITWGEGAPASPPVWEVQMEVMELPYALRVDAEHLAPQQGYLRLAAAERARVAKLMGAARRPRVGLVWSAGIWNPSRWVPFQTFRTLLDTGDAEFWSLQGEPEGVAWQALGASPHRRDVYECGDGIVSLAAAVREMDLVITVDTLAAHLAGALGVPCWILLQHRADWRWMCAREDTPWYPSLRLLRQRTAGDWGELIERVQGQLAAWLQRKESKQDGGQRTFTGLGCV